MHAIAYALTALSGVVVMILLMLAFPSLCHAETPPQWALDVFAETSKRVNVKHQNWYAHDYRYIPAGEEYWGNCASFSTTAMVLSGRAGHPAKVVQCGPRHVIAVSSNWIFDSRANQPLPASDIGRICPQL